MDSPVVSKSAQNPLVGAGATFSAFLVWGLSPVYWKALHTVPALEIIMHRMVWSFVFLLPLLVFRHHGAEFVAVLKNRRTLSALIATTILIAGNWLIYIWAINNGHVLQASLGYYICPLVNVMLGMIFLQERLRPTQVVSVLLAGAGVLIMTVQGGEFPWVALTLAVTFGLYGLIRKVVAVSALVGLSVETLLLSVPALAYLIYLNAQGTGAFLRVGRTTDLLLMGAALVTALPLLLFTEGARRLNLTTVGFLQFVSPSCMFLLAVMLYHEPMSAAKMWTFVLIWTALGLYCADSVRHFRR